MGPAMACRAAGFASPAPTLAQLSSTGITPFASPTVRQWASFYCSEIADDGQWNHSKTITDCVDGPSLPEVTFAGDYIDHSRDIWLDCFPHVTALLIGGASPMSKAAIFRPTWPLRRPLQRWL